MARPELELLLHPAGAGASGQASIAAIGGASDIRTWTIASTEILAQAPSERDCKIYWTA
jgi:hypothetical protein